MLEKNSGTGDFRCKTNIANMDARIFHLQDGYEVELSWQDTAANALVFTYTVQQGHETSALEVASADALDGTIRLDAT